MQAQFVPAEAQLLRCTLLETAGPSRPSTCEPRRYGRSLKCGNRDRLRGGPAPAGWRTANVTLIPKVEVHELSALHKVGVAHLDAGSRAVSPAPPTDQLRAPQRLPMCRGVPIGLAYNSGGARHCRGLRHSVVRRDIGLVSAPTHAAGPHRRLLARTRRKAPGVPNHRWPGPVRSDPSTGYAQRGACFANGIRGARGGHVGRRRGRAPGKLPLDREGSAAEVEAAKSTRRRFQQGDVAMLNFADDTYIICATPDQASYVMGVVAKHFAKANQRLNASKSEAMVTPASCKGKVHAWDDAQLDEYLASASRRRRRPGGADAEEVAAEAQRPSPPTPPPHSQRRRNRRRPEPRGSDTHPECRRTPRMWRMTHQQRHAEAQQCAPSLT